jgi:hypothetical protein
MVLSVQQTFAASRLSLIDDVLVTAGWTKHKDGWLPPERYRRAVEIANGRGHFARHLAIAMATQADQAVAQGRAPFDAQYAEPQP